MIPPTSIDGTDITGATIDGTDVTEITVGGDVVFSAEATLPTQNLIHRYDFSASSTTTTFVEDLAGSDDLTTGSFQGFRTLNGLQVGDFDDDFIKGSWSSSPSEPFSYATVIKFDDTDLPANIPIDGFNEFLHAVVYNDAQGGIGIFQGNALGFSQNVTLNIKHVYVTEFDSTDELFIDGTSVISGDAGSLVPTGITLGADHQDRSFTGFDGVIAEVLVYDSDLSTSPARADVEAYLGDKWGITV